jgi:outer membrane protein insertion porin family
MGKRIIWILIAVFISYGGYSQISLHSEKMDYASPKEYFIGGITVSGVKYLDNNVLIMLSGLNVGDKIKIPGDDISNAIKKLWKQGMFEDIEISYTKIQGDKIFLNIKEKFY